MSIDPGFLVTAFVTLFVVVDPIALAPLFVALTTGLDGPKRRAIAIRACGTAVGILTMFTLFGEVVLTFTGISMAAFRVAGGALLFLTALDMLFDRRTKRRAEQTGDDQPGDEDHHDPSVFPLGIPLIAGPGSIATVILLAGQNPGVEGVVWTLLVMLSVVASALLLFLASGLLERALGKTGINVVTRLLGMLLAALSVQFILDGLQEFGFAG